MAFVLLLSLMLVACSNDSSDVTEANDIKEMMHEYSVGSFEDITAWQCRMVKEKSMS